MIYTAISYPKSMVFGIKVVFSFWPKLFSFLQGIQLAFDQRFGMFCFCWGYRELAFEKISFSFVAFFFLQ
jgi:hypothetical protein